MTADDTKVALEVVESRGTATSSHISVARTSTTVEQSRCAYLYASTKPKEK